MVFQFNTLAGTVIIFFMDDNYVTLQKGLIMMMIKIIMAVTMNRSSCWSGWSVQCNQHFLVINDLQGIHELKPPSTNIFFN